MSVIRKESYSRIKKRIEKIVSGSAVSEDSIHSKNTLEWLIKIAPAVDEALEIAALGHDIERAIKERKVKRSDYSSYDEFKRAHAFNSAKILREIMIECDAVEEFIEDVCSLVNHHETGGDERADLLKEADAISFFDVNLPMYFDRSGIEAIRKRCLWGLKRLSKKGRKIIANFKYEDEELARIFQGELKDKRFLAVLYG